MLPGGFAEAILGQGATPETVAAFNREIGLDRPAIDLSRIYAKENHEWTPMNTN